MAQKKNEENVIQRIRLSRKQLKEMIAKEKGVLEPIFSKEYLNDTYLLPNGHVVVDFDTHGFLYSSFTDLKNWIRQLRKMQDEELPSHILKNRLLYGKEFLLHIPGLLEMVVDHLNQPHTARNTLIRKLQISISWHRLSLFSLVWYFLLFNPVMLSL